jgi:hypothetical protein
MTFKEGKMKTLLTAFLMVLVFDAKANLFEENYSYIHNETHQRLEHLKIDKDTQTGRYFDYREEKYKTVSLSDISRETHETIQGVKEGNMVLVKFSTTSLKPCEVWNLYENAIAHVGCTTGKITNRPELATYPVAIDIMIKEVKSLEGFVQKDKVRLMKDSGDLSKGDLVRIEHIFRNGSAMVQKMGLNLIDTSGLLLKEKVQVVELKDLSF